jgi:hypothetical protein
VRKIHRVEPKLGATLRLLSGFAVEPPRERVDSGPALWISGHLRVRAVAGQVQRGLAVIVRGVDRRRGARGEQGGSTDNTTSRDL